MKIIECEQGSPEWHKARAGRVTASRIADIMARTKSGYAASRKNYAAELLIERITGTVEPAYQSPAMQWGSDNEDNARGAYGLVTGLDVSQIGFVVHPEIEMAGASPDGLVAEDGLVEIKCPNSATHIETLLFEKVPSKYTYQMQWQIACTGRQWCDFVSYDPRMREWMPKLWITRVTRDDEMIAAIETEVRLFIEELDETVEKLRRKFNMEAAA